MTRVLELVCSHGADGKLAVDGTRYIYWHGRGKGLAPEISSFGHLI